MSGWMSLCYCCYSVTELCQTLCDPMDCSVPGSPVLQFPWFCSNSYPLSHWCYLTISSSTASSFCLQSFPASVSFPVSWLYASGGQNIGTSASASVLPMNIQDWFPLGLTGLISLPRQTTDTYLTWMNLKNTTVSGSSTLHYLYKISRKGKSTETEKSVLAWGLG